MSKCRYDLSTDCYNRDCLSCVLDKIRAEIIEKYWGCDICEWKIDYNCTSYYSLKGDINDILQIIEKYKGETEDT